MVKVEMYSTQACPSCVRAKQLLESKKVEWIEYRVDQDQDKFDEMKLRTNGSRTVPAIFINDQYVGGFDALWALEQSGELDKQLVD